LTSIPDLLRSAIERLRAAGVDSPRADARILLAHALGVAPTAIFTLSLPKQEGEVLSFFDSLLTRRIAREPVAYITGHKEFWSLDFDVGPGVLIPRPDTETLIEQLLAHLPDRGAPLDILDLGTGSGCLLVAALHEYPNARGVGVDSANEALAWTHRNIQKHGLGDRAFRLRQDFAQVSGEHHVILCNPPYICSADVEGLEPEVRLYEPRAALDGGSDGLDAYRALGPILRRQLKPGGLALLEIGIGQGEAVSRLLDLEIIGIMPDLAGISRVVIGRKS
jgi:release factor glutamine methyltransferase